MENTAAPTKKNIAVQRQTVSLVIGGILVVGFLVTFIVVFLIAQPRLNPTPSPGSG